MTTTAPEILTDDALSALGITPDSKFAEEITVFEHGAPTTISHRFSPYLTEDSNVSMGDHKQKAAAAFEVIQKSPAVLLEVAPWFVNNHMGDDEFDRWEPFVVGFPEYTSERQMMFTNLAPLSEVAYRIAERDKLLEETDPEGPPPTDPQHPKALAHLQEYLAFSRFPLDAAYCNEGDGAPEHRGVYIDAKPIDALHVCQKTWPQNLIIGQNDAGELYCGRSSLFDRHVDVALGLIRRTNQFDERKVAVYNDKSTKTALNALEFDATHAQYLGAKERWEVDLGALPTVISSLLNHDDIDYVSIHRVTERTHLIQYDPNFFTTIEGYPAL